MYDLAFIILLQILVYAEEAILWRAVSYSNLGSKLQSILT